MGNTSQIYPRRNWILNVKSTKAQKGDLISLNFRENIKQLQD
jgi:hypothetical protein